MPGQKETRPAASEKVSEGLDRSRLRTGIAVNFLGAAGKILDAGFFLIAARLFGTEAVGIFLFSLAAVEGVSKFVIQGFKEGAMMMVARRHGTEKIDDVYDITAQALRWTLLLSAGLCGIFYALAPWAADSIWGKPEAAPVIRMLIPMIPLFALIQVPLAATKGLVIMKHEVITIQFFIPAMMMVSAGVLGVFDTGATGLAIAIVTAHLMGAIFALWRFAREFDLGKLFAHVFARKRVRGLPTFAVPQCLNEVLNFTMMHLDIIILAAYLEPETIAFYGIASRIALALRKVRMGFASAYSPLIARYHAQGKEEMLLHSFSTVTRWVMTLALPVAGVLVAVRLPAMRLVHGSFTEHSEVLPILLVGPMVNTFLGLHANAIIMMGRSRLNLMNGIAGATVSVALNLFLIPRWGLAGAATATSASMSVLAMIQAIETRYLFGMRLRPRLVYKPLVAGAVASLAILAGWLAVGLESWAGAAPTAVAFLGAFAGMMALLGLEKDDRELLRGRSLGEDA